MVCEPLLTDLERLEGSFDRRHVHIRIIWVVLSSSLIVRVTLQRKTQWK